MARKLPLKRVPLTAVNGERPGFLDYGDMMGAMLRFPGQQQQGLSLDEVISCVAALNTLNKAIEDKASSVTFSDEQWKTLRDKLNRFQFTLADQAIAEFGLAIRDAPEAGLKKGEEKS
jgi:hypothetical protein